MWDLRLRYFLELIEHLRPQFLEHSQSHRVEGGELIRRYFLESIQRGGVELGDHQRCPLSELSRSGRTGLAPAQVNAVLAVDGVETGERLRCQLLSVGG